MRRRFYLNGTEAHVEHLGPDFSCLTGLRTHRNERRRGQARRILSMVVEEADAEDRAMFLQCESTGDCGPEPLRALYRSVGFVDATDLTPYAWRILRSRIGPCYRDVIMVRPSRSSRAGAAGAITQPQQATEERGPSPNP